jgi:hypothetical protein
MYIEKRRSKGKIYYRARESYRDPDTGKFCKRTIVQLGPYPTVAEAFTARLAAYLKRRAGRRSGPLSESDRRAFWALYQIEELLKAHDRGYLRSPEMKREYLRWSAHVSRCKPKSRIEPEPERQPGFARQFLQIKEAREVLDVGPFDTTEEIKAARDRLAMRFHPDLGGSDEAMAAINEAYETLAG